MKAARTELEVRPVAAPDDPGYPTARELGQEWLEDDADPLTVLPAIASALLSAIGVAACGTSQPAPAPPPPPPSLTVAEPAAVSTLATAPEPEPAPPVEAQPEPPPQLPVASTAGAGLPHAFSWEKSSLPIEWHPYGTGEPARLSEDAARAAVEQVFSAAGIHLARNVPFRRPGITCELDGYDASKKVGYVFVSWQDLEDPIGFRGKGDKDAAKALSHNEIRALLELEKSGQEHVVVISYQDDRFSWRYTDNKSEQQALLKLHQALRSYVAWLRSQRAL